MTWSDRTAQMKVALKSHVVPRLRRSGFKGTFPHFRRHRAECLDLLMFQFSLYGPILYVEIGTALTGERTLPNGQRLLPDRVRTYHVWPRRRLAPSIAGLREFDFGPEAASLLGAGVTTQLAHDVAEQIESVAEAWWRSPVDPITARKEDKATGDATE